MPKILEDCVKDLMKKGYDERSAYAICAKSTGWVKGKGGKWVNKKKKPRGGKNKNDPS